MSGDSRELAKILFNLFVAGKPCTVCGQPIKEEDAGTTVVSQKDGQKGPAHGQCHGVGKAG